VDEIDASTGAEELLFEAPEDGNYYFLVTSFDGSLGGYDVQLVGPATVLFELAIGDGVNGRFANGNSLLEYWLGGAVGDEITITAEALSDIDLVITIVDQEGNTLATIDDAFSGETETLTYTFASDDYVILQISDFFAGEGEFVLTLE
jgi:hypothetical protein